MGRSRYIVLIIIFLVGILPLIAQVKPVSTKKVFVQTGQDKQVQLPIASSANQQKGKSPAAIPPPVVINKYCNKPQAQRANEWIEFLVNIDNADIRGWKFRDCDVTQTSLQAATTFSNDPIWNHLRIGTVIVVWVGAGHTPQTFVKDGYIEVMATTAQYCTGGCAVDIALGGDLILLQDPAGITIHELGHRNDGITGPAFNNNPPSPAEPKISFIGSITDTYACMVSPGDTIAHYGYLSSGFQNDTKWAMVSPSAGDPFKGIPNPPNPYNAVASPTPNSDFWRKLRQPAWASQTLNFTYDPANTKVTLSWTFAPDAYPQDLTQGYMIVRNNVNTFGVPKDGFTYKPGDPVTGGGTVIDTINSNYLPNVTRVDNTTVLCPGGFFYRVYAFRYTTDQVKGNDYNLARGRAYNEANFASGQAIYPPTVPPVSATCTPNTFCAGDPPPASILLEAPGGSGGTNGVTGTLNWYANGCGTENSGTLLGPGTGANNSYTLSPAPAATTTYYARWENACSSSPCVSATVTINAVATPIFAGIGPLCQNSTPPPLPGVSVNGISGTWAPPTISTATPGMSTYTFTPTAGQCANPTTLNITIATEVAPLFDPIGPLCQNSTPPPLPNTSTNGITGTWNPATISTATIGTTTYTFTPAPGQCGIVFTMDITIATEVTPLFIQIGPLCQNSAAPPLPGTSTNGITGTWNPATVSTATVGTSTYTFTPGAGQCGIATTMDITIALQITPTFAQIGPLCQNSAAPPLQTESINGLTGTWFPATISTAAVGVDTYTFTPDAGQCGVNTTMNITVTSEVVPQFTQIGPLCQGSIPPSLPTTSLNGMTGIWNPATISTVAVGTTTYTFSPAAGQCGGDYYMNIDISTGITPTFASISDQCQNGTPPALPTTSLNGINGSWVPATINTATPGSTTYTFTPGAGTCAIQTTLTVNVTTGITPTIDISTTQTSVCEGATVNFTSQVTSEGTTPQYQWFLDGAQVGAGSQTYSYSPSASGLVWCKLISNLACAANPTYSDTISITLSPGPHVKLTDKEYLCSGTPSQLDAGADFTTYLWQDNSNDRYYTATNPGLYWVTVTDVEGCTGVSDTVLMKVCETGVYVPSGFSPNNDGNNDIFKAVATLDENTSFSMTIVDRWGQTVFESHSISVGWDGTYNGQPLPPGTYGWRIDYQSVNNLSAKPVVLKGTVTLLR